MPLVFARKKSQARNARAITAAARRSAAQGCLWDPTVVGRSFVQAAMTFRSGEQVLRERLQELELKRRRAQIAARRVVEGREEKRNGGGKPGALPFAS
jgi:hypothetical protein